MAVGVGLFHPIVAVAEPVVAILFGLLGEPGDFVVSPDPDSASFGWPGWRLTPKLSISTR